MKKGNEEKIKEILSELEEDLVEEETDKDISEDANSLKSEDKKMIKEDKKIYEKKTEKEVKKSEENKIEKETKKSEENKIEKETKKSEEKKVSNSEKENVKKSDEGKIEFNESSIRKIGNFLVDRIKEYKYVLILDFAVFLFLFFVVPMVILEVKPILWMTLFLIFTILPTIAFYIKKLFKKYQVVIGVPFIYICILCILDSCTLRDLYGITDHGTLDKLPAWADAILVTFIIVFIQYISLLVMDIAKKCLNANNKKRK